MLGYVLERRAASSADTLVNLDYRAIWHCMGFARNDITEVFGQEAESLRQNVGVIRVLALTSRDSFNLELEEACLLDARFHTTAIP